MANSLLTSLSNSFQVSPSFFLNNKNHIVYNLTARRPRSTASRRSTTCWTCPSPAPTARPTSSSSTSPRLDRTTGPAVRTTYNLTPVVDIFCSVQGRDLGGVAGDINKIVDDARKHLPRGSQIKSSVGRCETMHASFVGLAWRVWSGR